jgi:hypothetical protein
MADWQIFLKTTATVASDYWRWMTRAMLLEDVLGYLGMYSRIFASSARGLYGLVT